MTINEAMTEQRLNAIQERVDASTWAESEPWDYAEDDWDGWCVSICDSGFGTAYVAKDIQQGEDEGRSDAALIVHAPQDLTDLLAEVERLRARPTITDDMVERAARSMSAHWHDWHTNEALGRQRALAIAALDAALGTEEES